MSRALDRTRDALTVPSAQLKALVREDPLGLSDLLRERFSDESNAVTGASAEDGYVSPDGRNRLLIVKPRRPPFDVDFCRALLNRLDGIERSAWQHSIAACATPRRA